jgi:hypothetical protein
VFFEKIIILRKNLGTMQKFAFFCLMVLLGLVAKAQEQQIVVPYTLADRDRAIRTEARLETLDAKFGTIDQRFDAIDKRFDAMEKRMDRMEDKFDSYFMWGFGLVLMSIFGLIGFIVYDRRTTLAPVENKTERILKALQEAAEKDTVLREALKKTALW